MVREVGGSTYGRVGALLNDDDPVIIMTNAPRIMGSSAPSRGVCGA